MKIPVERSFVDHCKTDGVFASVGVLLFMYSILLAAAILYYRSGLSLLRAIVIGVGIVSIWVIWDLFSQIRAFWRKGIALSAACMEPVAKGIQFLDERDKPAGTKYWIELDRVEKDSTYLRVYFKDGAVVRIRFDSDKYPGFRDLLRERRVSVVRDDL